MTAFCSVPVARPDTAGTNAQGCDAEGVAQPRGHQNRAPSTSSVKHQPQPQPPSQEHQEQQRAKRHASTLAGNSPDNLLRAARLRLREHSAAAPNRKVVPEPVPIGFEYTVYYPGNMDLIITAGHNGINTPGTELSPPMTHFFQPYLPSDNDKENEEVGELDPMRFAVPVEDKSRAAVRAQVGKCFPPPHAQRSPLPFSVLTHDQQDGQHRQQHYHHHHHQQQQQQQQQQPFNLDTSTVLASCVSPPLTSDTPPPQEILPPWPPTLMHDLPERNESAGGNFKGDLNTTKIAMALAQSVSDILSSTQSPTPLRPHVVLFRVHRRYVDVNRNISNPLENAVPEASPKSAAAWHEYHGVIDHVRAVIESRNNRNRNIFGTQRGLLLDIHEMIEIGYLLDSDKLSLEDAALNAAAKEFAPIMSIRSLIDRWWEEQQQLNANPPSSVAAPPPPSSLRPSAASFASVLRGSHDSLGGMLQRQGLNSVPGPQNRAPCDACLFFFGGYTIQRHGSRDSGAIDAIQLELPRSLRLRTRDELQEITWRMGQAVTEFLSLYYDLEADHRIVPAFAFEEKSPSSMHELHKRTTTALVSPRKAIHVRSSKKQQQHRLHRSRSAVSLTSSEKGGANESGDESDLEESMNQPPSDHSTAVYAELPSTRPALLRKSSRL
ncbi:hypothetical protein BGZ73_008319 [Actinomortierella ambigua]|nr:hypothetical protein BGZ73_008319 [Actinomortierella ambigua]